MHFGRVQRPGITWLTAKPIGSSRYSICQQTGSSLTRAPWDGGSPWKNGGRMRATMSQDMVPAHSKTTTPTKIRLPMPPLLLRLE